MLLADAAETTPVHSAPAPKDDLGDVLLNLEHAAASADLRDLPGLIGRLVSVEEQARFRLRHGVAPVRLAGAQDENLSALDAARRLGISRDWLYRNASRLPFAIKIGRRVVFSAKGLERWNRQRLGG